MGLTNKLISTFDDDSVVGYVAKWVEGAPMSRSFLESRIEVEQVISNFLSLATVLDSIRLNYGVTLTDLNVGNIMEHSRFPVPFTLLDLAAAVVDTTNPHWVTVMADYMSSDMNEGTNYFVKVANSIKIEGRMAAPHTTTYTPGLRMPQVSDAWS